MCYCFNSLPVARHNSMKRPIPSTTYPIPIFFQNNGNNQKPQPLMRLTACRTTFRVGISRSKWDKRLLKNDRIGPSSSLDDPILETRA